MKDDLNGRRLVIIGIDGATFNILRLLQNKKSLPFFNKLMQNGCYGNLESSLPVNGAASWASFFSGKNPGKHNIYDFFTTRSEDTQPPLISNHSIKSRLLWNILENFKMRSILINIPIFSEPEPINGIMSSGLLTDMDKPFFYPAHVAQDLQYQAYSLDSGFARNQDKDEYFTQILKTQKSQEKSFRKLILNESWNLAAITFNGIARAQSVFWDEPEKLEKLYRHIDLFLEHIHKIAGEDTNFLVVSNYGFKPVAKKFFVNEWLWELKLLQKKITTNRARVTDLDDYIYSSLTDKTNPITRLLAATKITKDNIRRVLPDAISELLKRATSWSIRKLFPYEYLDIVWDRTQAYFISANTQGININLKGREPFGTVNPGRDYERLRDQIIGELYRLRDPYTLENVVDEVYRKEDIFFGDHLNEAPDIVFKPHNFDYYLSPEKRTCRLYIGSANDDYPIQAHHDPQGLFFMTGPKIKHGEKLKTVSIYDMLPTILYSLGISPVDNLDGHILHQIFEGTVQGRSNDRPQFIPFEDSLPFFPDEYFKKKFSMNAASN